MVDLHKKEVTKKFSTRENNMYQFVISHNKKIIVSGSQSGKLIINDIDIGQDY